MRQLYFQSKLSSKISAQGSSLLEILIALTLFSTVALGAALYSLRALQMTRLALYDTEILVSPRKSQSGFTMVELLISITIGVILLGACLQILILVKQNYVLQQGLARIQENARIVDELLGHAVRSAGNMGCSALEDKAIVKFHHQINAADYGLTFLKSIESLTQSQFKKNPLISPLSAKRIVENTDILWVKKVQENTHLLRIENNNLILKNPIKIESNQVIVLSDCYRADFVRVNEQINRRRDSCNIKLKAFQTDETLNNNYQNDAEIAVLASVMYFLGDTYRKNSHHQSIYALYETDLNGRTVELVEGVEQFRIWYGIREGEKVIYLPQEEVQDTHQIISVKAQLLLTSIEPGLSKSQPYMLDDKRITPKDKLFRKWWNFEWYLKGKSNFKEVL